MLHLLHVTRSDFKNLWVAVLIRNVLRFSTLGLVFLVPDAVQSEVLIPVDVLGRRENVEDDDSLELVPLNDKVQV